MIKKLQRKFLLLSLTALFVLLALIVVGINILNYRAVIKEADEILWFLSRNKGAFPGFAEHPEGEPLPGKGEPLPPGMSSELPYEARYFSVVLDNTGKVLHTRTDRIASIDEQEAIAYAKKALQASEASGFQQRYRYTCSKEGGHTRVTFLDLGRQLNMAGSFLLFSVLIALGAYVLVATVLILCSKRIIRPIAQSYEKQKLFITDAGHEIKTPLTVIRANTDLLELDIGENECLADIRQQTERLATLTSDLVYLSRMEENAQALPMADFPLSEIVQEAVSPFHAVAKAQQKEFFTKIQPLLSLKGNAKAVEQLINLLMDNALKYTPKNGVVELSLCREGHAVVLRVGNTTVRTLQKKELESVFDRFYRADAARSSQTGGHGIGLSIAHSIVQAHGGRIRATAPKENTFLITVSLPL
ncbi:MAG: HAMP domain-containing histidine kinase [Ruminococcaceae bacterium]|nr:HAMP domain-containing histidine kinase [Oscillospiraceae bacterium]